MDYYDSSRDCNSRKTWCCRRHLIDLGITKNYWGYELGLNINNILDEDYEAPHGFNQNGRNLSFIFKRKF